MLAVRRLTKHYGALVAVHDVSFEAWPGEVLGLLGPNGSGKSTTVKILTGLLRQTAGTVQLDRADAFADLDAYKRIVGYVPEEPHLYSYLTGPEYLRLIGRLRGLPNRTLDDKIDRFLQLLGIYDDRHQTLASYSKGMRQKILIDPDGIVVRVRGGPLPGAARADDAADGHRLHHLFDGWRRRDRRGDVGRTVLRSARRDGARPASLARVDGDRCETHRPGRA